MIIAALLLLLLLLTAPALLLPVGAQPTPPPVTPTRTVPDLVGFGEEAEAGSELLLRLGLWGAIVAGFLAGIAWFVFALTKKAGETLVDYLNRVFLGRKLDKRIATLEAREAEHAAERQQRTAAAAGLEAYLAWLQEELQYLPQIPLDQQQQDLTLREVYVPLRVVEREQMEQFTAYMLGEFGGTDEYRARREAFTTLERSHRVYRLLSDADCLPSPPPEAAPRRRPRPRPDRDDPPEQPEEVTLRRLLLVGDAGSGKTTTLHFGALMLACDCQQQSNQLTREQLDLFCEAQLLPVYIRLTLMLRYLQEKYKQDRAQLTNAPADLVFAWVDADIPRQVATPDFPPDLISRRMQAGGCLILFDGLDETGDAEERNYVKRLINNLVQACPDTNRYIVASRPFEGVGQGLTGFVERRLSPLDESEIKQLLHQWFNAVSKLEAGARRRRRRSAEQEYDELWHKLASSPRLFDMATNPLLLTSMAVLVHGGDPLPPERAKIYNRLVALTLVRWREAQILAGQPPDSNDQPIRLYAEESDDDVRRRLQEVAAWMLQQQRREILLREAQELLCPTYAANRNWTPERSRNHVQALLVLLSLHSGLIQERDQGYSFIHFTLQEYLTARDYDERDDITGLVAQWCEPRWRETILLAVGHWATSGYPQRADQLLRTLLAEEEPEALFLAAEALDEANARLVTKLLAVLDDTIERLKALAFNPSRCPDPRTRNQAAGLLDRLDADQRSSLDPEHPAYWTERIAPGPFVMGDDNGKRDNEKPAFTCRIPRPYALARYPVTNRQYERFLEDLRSSGRNEEAEQRRPRYWPGRSYRAGAGNHPVVGVSWLDACAFAQWANDTFLTPEQRARGEQIRLPTEPEWERAAAYPLTLPADNPGMDRREYPWGDWPANLTDMTNDSINSTIPANIDESKVGGTTAVGIFPQGRATCGAEELAGNVWEWCSTPYQRYPLPEDLSPETIDTTEDYKDRTYVLRGGSWFTGQSDARCAYRLHSLPVNLYYFYGFRLAHSFS